MSNEIFCLACHRKNAADAKVCNFCGSSLVKSSQDQRTTQEMASLQAIPAGTEPLSKHYLPKLPDNSFALFVMDDSEPLIVENSEAIDLGRFIQNPTTAFVDLTRYDAVTLGVSRLHARITWSEGIYRLEDLASTNGTWLNSRRLASGKSYQLHNGDSILLGQLQMTIFLPESLHKWEVNFDVRLNKLMETVYPQILTPYFMKTVLSQFLQAIIDFQQVCLQCRGQNIEVIHILSIQAAEESPLLHVSLNGANEAIHYIRKWVNPLRQFYVSLAAPEAEIVDSAQQKELMKTIDNILLDINPGLDEDAQKGFGQQLQPAVITLVSSELEIVP